MRTPQELINALNLAEKGKSKSQPQPPTEKQIQKTADLIKKATKPTT